MTERRTGPLGLAVARSAVRVRGDLALAALDAVAVVSAYLLILVLRFDGRVPALYWNRFWKLLPVVIVAHLGSNLLAGLYGPMWKHASVREARRVLTAGGAVVALVSTLYLLEKARVPASVVVLGGAATTILLGAIRFQSRLFAFNRTRDRGAGGGIRVLVIGAGESAAMIVREMLRSPSAGLVPVAVLDDDPRKQGRSLAGVPVMGRIGEMEKVAAELGVNQVLLAIPSAEHDLVRRVAQAAERAEVTLKVLPPVSELLGTARVRDARDLRIEDLLGRQEVVTDLERVRALLVGKRVLITGAGGSIGAEIARQVAEFEPAALVLLDHDETHLHDVATVLTYPATEMLADIRNRAVVRAGFERHRPEVVFHAAAHKHVPLLEDHPCEAVETNVLGTVNVIDAATAVGVRQFVFISTDKAVHPSSVMGASKQLGEQALLARRPGGGRWCAVRFGNVIGSRGSVIPTFARQIASGGPVTVTDARMTRFFMSIEEAVQLVLQAASFADGGEVFMLDMGEPVNILQLARRMIRLSGYTEAEMPIRISGVRPGEKLTEELRAPGENAWPTPHPGIVGLYPLILPRSDLDQGLHDLRAAVDERADAAARQLLFGLVRRAPAPADDPRSV